MQVTNFVFKLGDRAPWVKEVWDLLVVFQTGRFFFETYTKRKVFDNLIKTKGLRKPRFFAKAFRFANIIWDVFSPPLSGK